MSLNCLRRRKPADQIRARRRRRSRPTMTLFSASLLLGLRGLLTVDTLALGAPVNEDGLYIYMRWPYHDHWKPFYDAAIVADYVDGASISLEWNRIELRPGEYDWSTFDPWIVKTVAAHKKLAVGVIAGDFAPEWLYGDKIGVPRLQFSFNKTSTGVNCATLNQPEFWSGVYLKRYAGLLNALAAHLHEMPISGQQAGAAYDALRVVKISGINVTTEELRVPANKPDNGPCKQSDAAAVWANGGYTPDKALAAWTTIAEDTNRAFPDKILAVDIIHRRAFPTVDGAGRPYELAKDGPDEMMLKIVDRGLAMLKRRFMVKWDALSQARMLPPEVEASGRRGAKVGWQMNDFLGVRDGSGCVYIPYAIKPCASLDDFRAILENGIAKGGRFIEIQPPNVNAKYAPAFRSVHGSLLGAGSP